MNREFIGHHRISLAVALLAVLGVFVYFFTVAHKPDLQVSAERGRYTQQQTASSPTSREYVR